MHPPVWVCEKLYKEAPQLRLAWKGRPAKFDELNAGNFALVSLFPAYTYWNEERRTNFYREFWGMTIKQLPHKVNRTRNHAGVSQVVFAHYDRGPVFSRRGIEELDYDPFEVIPVYLQDLSWDQVMLGRIVWQIPAARKEAAKTKKERDADTEERKANVVRDARSTIDAAARQQANEEWFNANRTGAAGTANITRDYSTIAAHKEGDEDSVLTTRDVA